MKPPLDTASARQPALSDTASEDELRAMLKELHTAEEELRQQNEALAAAIEMAQLERERYRELFDAAPDGYLVTDPEGVIHEANQAAAALLARRASLLVGKPLRVFVHPTDRLQFDRLLGDLHTGRPVAGAELRLGTGDGPPVTVAVHATAARGPTLGGAVRWLFHDLTAIKEARDRLVLAERLAAVGQTVAALAHESRNALQRAQSCLRMLRADTYANPDSRGYADRAGRALGDLARLFEDVRVVAAPPALRCEPCDLAAVWRRTWEEVAAGRAATLHEPPPGGNARCVADAFRLGQVFRNIFENALAAGAGRVTVTTGETDLAGRPAVRISVRDDGPGLTPDHRARLFEPFFTTRPDGMGLGLAIVRSLVEAHGGTVGAADPPAGTEILITLPREPT